jgi:hypothetical protein
VRVPGRLAVTVAAAVLAAGCGGDTEDDAPHDPGSTSPVSTPTAGSTAAPSPSASPASPSPSDDSAATLADARALAARDGLPLLVPDRLPAGWTFQSAVYGAEGRGNWQLTVADADGGEVAVRQALVDSPAAYYADIRTLLGSGARPSGTVDVGPLGTWVGYDGVRHPRRFAVGQLDGTNVVLWADDADSLHPFAELLHEA